MPRIPLHRLTIKVPSKYGPDDRYAIAQEIVDYIVERTQDRQLLKDGRTPIPELSEKYAEYKRKVTGSDDPDLTLSGDMLADLDVVNTRRNGQVVVGFSDSKQNAKADGHITGNVGVKRDFFGIYQYEVKQIIRELERDGQIG